MPTYTKADKAAMQRRPTRQCCVEECERPVHRIARNVYPLCNHHYHRIRLLRFKIPPGMSITDALDGPNAPVRSAENIAKAKAQRRLPSVREVNEAATALDSAMRKVIATGSANLPPLLDPMFAPMISRRELLLNRVEAVTLAHDKLIPFVRLTMPHPDMPDDVRFSQYEDALHHRAIAAALEEVERGTIPKLIIVAPPRHGKTELTSKKLLAWYSGRHPEHHAIFGTYNEVYAKDIGRSVRDTVTTAAFNQVFPGYALKDYSQAADRFETTKGGILAFVGRGGTTTGRGGHILIVDDPIKNQKEASSPTIREDLWQWFNRVVRTRMMTSNARIIIIMTRWNEDDLVGRLTDPTNEHYDPNEARTWKIIDLPAIAMSDHDALGRKPGEALWPERFDIKFLEDQQRADPMGFSALYQGRPTPPGGAFFLEQYLKTYRQHELPKALRMYAASDHAVATRQFSDKTCIIPFGVDERDNIYILPDVIWRSMPADVAWPLSSQADERRGRLLGDHRTGPLGRQADPRAVDPRSCCHGQGVLPGGRAVVGRGQKPVAQVPQRSA
jgi:hypothetical protein